MGREAAEGDLDSGGGEGGGEWRDGHPVRRPAVMQDEFSEPGRKLKKGKLTKMLLEEGQVTPEMMKQLKREIANEDLKS